MAVRVKDSARPDTAGRGIAAAPDATGTQRVFDNTSMWFLGDQIDPHVTTKGRLYGTAQIIGSVPTYDDTGHIIADEEPVVAWLPWDELFSASNQGLALDFSDASTLYTDEKFSTNVSAYGDPVGGVLDKSQGLVLGSEVWTNPSAAMGAEWSYDAGVYTYNGGSDSSFQNNSITSAGIWRIQLTISGLTTGSINIRVGGTSTNDYQAYSNGVHTFYAEGAGGYVYVRAAGANAGVQVYAISVKELLGNHLIQATAAARPIWTRHPKSGVRNLFDGSDNPYGKLVIDNVVRGSLGVDGVLSPAFSAASVQAYCRFVSAYAYAASTQHTFSATLTPQANGRYAWLATYDGTNDYGIMFDLSNGTVVGRRATADTEDDYGIEPSGSGYRVFVTFTSVASPSASVYSAQIGVSSDAALSFLSTFVGDEDVLIENVQIEASALPTAYQTRVSKYNVTEAGVADCYGLTFDGVDDYLVTAANLDLSGTDEVTLTAGLLKSRDSASQWVMAHNDIGNGSFILFAPNSASAGDVAFTSKGNVEAKSFGTLALGDYAVATGIGDISAPSSKMRVDAALAQDVVTSQGTGNFASAITNIGRRNTGANYFLGTIYGVTVTDYILDADQLAALEAWTAANTPEVVLA